MPKFAAVDHAGVVTNVLVAGSLEDLTHDVSHGVGLDGDLAFTGTHEELDGAAHRQVEGYGDPVRVPTDRHLDAHGADQFVEVTAETGRARVGMVYVGGEFQVGPEPLADASDQQIVDAARARGLVSSAPPSQAVN